MIVLEATMGERDIVATAVGSPSLPAAVLNYIKNIV